MLTEHIDGVQMAQVAISERPEGLLEPILLIVQKLCRLFLLSEHLVGA